MFENCSFTTPTWSLYGTRVLAVARKLFKPEVKISHKKITWIFRYYAGENSERDTKRRSDRKIVWARDVIFQNIFVVLRGFCTGSFDKNPSVVIHTSWFYARFQKNSYGLPFFVKKKILRFVLKSRLLYATERCDVFTANSGQIKFRYQQSKAVNKNMFSKRGFVIL